VRVFLVVAAMSEVLKGRIAAAVSVLERPLSDLAREKLQAAHGNAILDQIKREKIELDNVVGLVDAVVALKFPADTEAAILQCITDKTMPLQTKFVVK
jgi:hypothetical protein